MKSWVILRKNPDNVPNVQIQRESGIEDEQYRGRAMQWKAVQLCSLRQKSFLLNIVFGGILCSESKADYPKTKAGAIIKQMIQDYYGKQYGQRQYGNRKRRKRYE